MGFEKFGKVSLTPETKAAAFVDFLAQGKVMGTQCKKCGKRYFPPRADCSGCLGTEMNWFEIKGKGRLLTYTTANYGPAGFEDDVPYTLAVAAFENDIKVFGRLSKDIKENEIKVGMELKPVVVNLPGERLTYELVRA